MAASFVSLKARRGQPSDIHGLGIFAQESIGNGEVVAVKGGQIVDRDFVVNNPEIVAGSEMQVTGSLFVAPATAEETEESMIYVNHSCDPNIGIKGNIVLVAMRDIQTGEELTADYVMCYSDTAAFICNCGSSRCRGSVGPDDWKRPELQERYRGYFSWYVQEKIQAS